MVQGVQAASCIELFPNSREYMHSENFAVNTATWYKVQIVFRQGERFNFKKRVLQKQQPLPPDKFIIF